MAELQKGKEINRKRGSIGEETESGERRERKRRKENFEKIGKIDGRCGEVYE